jgi:Tol biopolymer transport system component
MNTVTRRTLILLLDALRAVAVSVALIASVGCGEQSEPVKQARPSATTVERSDPPRLASNGKIAFTRGDDIWVADARGGRVRRLTQPPRSSREDGPFYWGPSWSPDGARIAVTQTTYGGHEFNEVVVMEADGTGASAMTPGFALEPTWSPDGKALAFSAQGALASVSVGASDALDWVDYVRLPEYCIVVMDAAEEDWCSDEPVYDVGLFEDRSPAWSPDGEWIAFVRAEEDRVRLLLVKAEGGATQSPVTLEGLNPDWSPDGRSIAFDDGQDIYVVDVKSGRLTRLTETGAREAAPSWSPDGTKILFARAASSSQGGGSDVWVMDAQGANQRLLIPDATEPDWQPLWP